jgi:ABC-2 type transport system permease protein
MEKIASRAVNLHTGMKPLLFKEIRQYFSSLTGYLAIGLFLLLMGLFLFVFPDTSILDFGYATLDKFFELAPWILLLLVPAVTMRSFSDEFRSGTWEMLKTRPLSLWQIVLGKYLAALAVVLLALLPTLIYVLTIRMLSINGSIDGGGIAGAYVGLICLAALFTAIGVCCSAFTGNSIISFLLAAFACFICYNGFQALASLPAFAGGADYWIEMMGIDEHYRSLSSGVLRFRNLFYFIIFTLAFLLITRQSIARR